MKRPRFYGKFRESCLVVAEHCHGRKGLWAYEAFDFINRTYFSNRLPWPHILWALTPHGGCIAWASTARDKSPPPIITVHPSLLRGSEKQDPWAIPEAWPGASYAFDTLLHECVHVHIDYNLGGHDGRTSHDCDRWARQVNRLAPRLGFHGIQAGVTKTKRVPDYTAPRTVRGKVATRVVRVVAGNVPFVAVAGFPSSLRQHLGQAGDYYSRDRLPAGAPQF